MALHLPPALHSLAPGLTALILSATLTGCMKAPASPPGATLPPTSTTSGVPRTTATATSSSPPNDSGNVSVRIGSNGEATVATTMPAPPYRVPAVARRHDAEGAQAFVRHFWATTVEASRRADLELLTPYYTQDCDGCRAIQYVLLGVRDGGAHLAAQEYSLHDLSFSDDATGARTTATYRRSTSGERIIDAQGATHTGRAYVDDTTMDLVWSDGHWLVDEVVSRR